MLERDLQEILQDKDFKLGGTLFLKRNKIVNKVGVSTDLSNLSNEEVSVGVFLGALASDKNIEGIALHITANDDLHASFIFGMLDRSPESVASYRRASEAIHKLGERFDQSIPYSLWQVRDRKFSDISRSIRKKALSTDQQLIGIIRFK